MSKPKHTSRVLKSTARYEQFVKKLRASEEEIKRKQKVLLKEAEEKHHLNFFMQSDRRCLLTKLETRFNYCMQSYENDLNLKREKLKNIYLIEERENMCKLVQKFYNGREAAWQNTKDRLAHQLAKRKQEHDAKYATTELSLSKCIHALPLVKRQQSQETVKIWGIQVQEKQSRKMAEKEIDNMWQSVLMKETEALSARVEYELFDRYRRDQEAKEQSDRHLAMCRMERAKQQEMLKQETLQMLAKFKKDSEQEDEEKRQRLEMHRQQIKEINDMIKVRKEAVIRQKHNAKVLRETWDSLTNQQLSDEYAEKHRKKRLERYMGECNLKLAEQKHQYAKQKDDNIPLILAEYQRRENAVYTKQEQLIELSRKIEKETRKAIEQQIQEAERVRLSEHNDSLEYERQVTEQLEQLVKHKELTDAQAKKLFHKDQLGQLEYNKVLKERARQEAQEQSKKCQIVNKEYQELMMRYGSKYGKDHPFMKQISTLSKCVDTALKTKQACRCGPSGILPNIF